MWETGTIDSVMTGRERRRQDLLGARTSARTTKPGEQVPRMPSGSQRACLLELDLVARASSTTTWSPGSASGRAAQGHEEIVGVRAVAHGRGLLLERPQFRRRSGVTAAIERPMSPPVPTSEVTEAIRRCSSATVAQVLLEPRGVVEVAHDAGHLDLVHREDHRARAAAAAELEAGRRDRLEADAAAAELRRHERRTGPLAPERLDRLDREARVAVDVDRRSAPHLVGDAAYRVQERLVSVGCTLMRRRLTIAARSSARAIEAMLSNTPRVSMRSGNSTSKWSSSASITLTLACDVMPAW